MSLILFYIFFTSFLFLYIKQKFSNKPATIKRSIDDLPFEILIEIIGNLSSYVDDYLPIKLVSPRWNEAINCYFKSIKHLIPRRDTNLVTKDGLIMRIFSNRPDIFISYMELFPNLKAVALFDYTEKGLDILFNYLNTRPKITSLELRCNIFTEFQNDVKLENIRNFALSSYAILSEDVIGKLFQPDHKLTQLCVNTQNRWDLSFEDGISILKRMPSLKRFSQQIFLLRLTDYENTDLFIYTKQPRLFFENLESYSFYAYGVSFLNYVDNFVACCPNLKSIDCFLIGGDAYKMLKLNNLRVHTNVENLVIQGFDSSWKFVLKFLEMFPMITNLALKNMKGIGHNQISQALLKLPNLSLLYLRHLEEFPKGSLYADVVSINVYSSNVSVYKDIVQVDCMALKDEYNSKYGRNLQIVRRDGPFETEEFPFRHGFNFMQNIFWPDSRPRLLTD